MADPAHRLATEEVADPRIDRLVVAVVDPRVDPNAVQRLNIPLSRHTKTTRPNRQVVWLVGFGAVAALFLTWRFTTLWFTGDALLQAAPVGTVLAVELQLNRRTWPVINGWLGSTPLVSNRSLDLYDLAPLTKGSLAVFLSEDGGRAVAIRGSLDEEASRRLKAANVWIQEVAPGIMLLSESLVPVVGIESKSRPAFFPSSNAWLGRVELPDAGLSGSLIDGDNGLTMAFPHIKTISDGEQLPSTMLSMLFDGTNPSGFLDAFAGDELLLLVEQNESGETETLIASNNADTDEATITKYLQEIGAYLSPKIQKTTLQDGTSSRELIVDTSLVSIEQVSVAGHLMLRVRGEDNRMMYGGLIDETAVLATGESIISSYVNQTEGDCTGNTGVLEPRHLLSEVSAIAYEPTLVLLTSIFKQISAISVESTKYSSEVTFCMI